MKLTRLRLFDFRNYETLDLTSSIMKPKSFLKSAQKMMRFQSF